MRWLVLVVVLAFGVSFGASAESSRYEVTPIEHDDIRYAFTNVRFTTYQGRPGLSIDFEAYADTTFRSRLLHLADMALLMYHRDLTRLQPIVIRPSLFNSFNLGRVVDVDPRGEVVRLKGDVAGRVKAIEVESKGRHSGSVLFLLPEDAILIHAIQIGNSTTPLREVPNRYVDLPRFDLDSIRQVLAGVKIPMQPHIHLLNVLIEMQKFEGINASLKQTW